MERQHMVTFHCAMCMTITQVHMCTVTISALQNSITPPSPRTPPHRDRRRRRMVDHPTPGVAQLQLSGLGFWEAPARWVMVCTLHSAHHTASGSSDGAHPRQMRGPPSSNDGSRFSWLRSQCLRGRVWCCSAVQRRFSWLRSQCLLSQPGGRIMLHPWTRVKQCWKGWSCSASASGSIWWVSRWTKSQTAVVHQVTCLPSSLRLPRHGSLRQPKSSWHRPECHPARAGRQVQILRRNLPPRRYRCTPVSQRQATH